ncbi:oxidoreductase [Auricularia subglabra TFB-10046 SS5]|uniref:3-dehydrosphinganine reductase n=1 Tax=Auricularia subglabra (strain TFB-10046 / SS5) TaxID=717982 RepID=J0WWP3_AURST|nr:oxidoreductase [Auricularia subglabra TFB-10046 SS5]
MFGLFASKWDPKDKHCYVTGGSQGLGLAVALELTKLGAHVSIVARNQQRLNSALEELQEVRIDKGQQLNAYSFSLDNFEQSQAALVAASAPFGGRVPDALICCAGSSQPRFFVEMTPEQLSQGFVDGYWVQAWTAFAGAKMLAKQRAKGVKIVLVSSTLGYMSFVGWSNYSPAKTALRSLADTLRSELMLYDATVHLFCPPTMRTAGYERENMHKPAITLAIEEADEGITVEQGARALISGVRSGQAHIAADILTHLFRASTRGSTPYNNGLADAILGCAAWIAVPFWRWGLDSRVRAHRAEHERYLQERGFYED